MFTGQDVHAEPPIRTSVKLSHAPGAVGVLFAAGRQRSGVQWLWLCAQVRAAGLCAWVRAAGRITAAQRMHALRTN
jgi:hypothetical protein